MQYYSKLYGIELAMCKIYFTDEHALENYASAFLINIPFKRIYLEYYKKYFGKKDVISITDDENNTNLYSIIDDKTYDVYKIHNDGLHESWRIEFGNLRTEYNSLVSNNIEFDDSHYEEYSLIRSKKND